MIEAITVTGMVITVSPVGEYDRRIVLLTREKGRITAFARGARRQHSQLLAATGLCVYGQFNIIPGRDAYTLVSAQVENYFEDIGKDPMKVCYASYFMEIASYYGRENNDESEMLKLLYLSLRVLCREILPNPLVRLIYELRSLVVNGEYPETFHCILCGSEKDIDHISPEKHGVICHSCLSQAGRVFRLSPSGLYAMQYIITAPITKLYGFTLSEEVLYELQQIMEAILARQIDRHFKSLEILEIMEMSGI